MNEHEKDTRFQEDTGRLPARSVRRSRRRPPLSDLVVDLSEMKELDVTSLALLLTAQQIAQQGDRAIWLAGVPGEVWHTLYAMGLGRFFRPFPTSAGAAA